MACLVVRNKETDAIEEVKTLSGEPSILYQSLLKENQGNAEQALKAYAFTLTPNFKEQWIKEEEPTIDEYNNIVGKVNKEVSLMPSIRDEDVPREGLTKLIHLKNNLLHNAQQRLVEVRGELKSNKGNAVLTNELSKKKVELEDYINGNEAKNIEGLKKEISRLELIGSKEPEVIRPFIEKELSRLDKLVTGNIQDTKEAQEIIRHIKGIADLRLTSDDNKRFGHPLFEYNELFNDEGEFAISPQIEKIYNEWGKQADIAEGKLLARSRELFTEVVGENDAVEKMYGEGLTYQKIVREGEGMKDTHWWDMFLMDIGTGTFSKNGIIPQVAKLMINEAFEKRASWTKEVNEEIEEVLPEAKKELERLGYVIKIPGIRNVSYDLFRQVDKYGNLKPNMVGKFSFEYQEELDRITDKLEALKKAAYEEDTKEAQVRGFTKMYAERDRWLKANTKIVNPALLKEIAEDPEFSQFQYAFGSHEEQEAHVAEIKALVGEKYYQKVVTEQKDKIKQFLVQRQHALNNLLAEEGVGDELSLSPEGKFTMKVYDFENNPFMGAIYSDAGKPFKIGTANIHTKFEFNTHLPLSNKGYYDENYSKIEANNALTKLYEAFHKVTSTGKQSFDYETQRAMLDTSLAGYEKTMLELFLDKDTPVHQKVSKSFRKIIDSMKNSFGVNKQDAFSFAKINSITGLPEYTLNESFLHQNSGKIRDMFRVRATLFMSEFNKIATVGVSKLTKFTSVRVTRGNQEALVDILSRYTRTPKDKILTTYSQEVSAPDGTTYTTIPVGKIINAQVLHEVAQGMSIDLPRVIKMYANNIAQYQARKDVLPTMELLKSHYEGISNQATNNVDEAIRNGQDDNNNRLNVLRNNAVRQYDNWFHRVVLGNYGLRKNYGVLSQSEEDLINNPTEKYKVTSVMRFFQDGKLMNADERKLAKQLDKAIEVQAQNVEDIKAIDPGASPAAQASHDKAVREAEVELSRLQDIKVKLGKNFAFSGVFDALMNFIRWRGLGFNVPSGIKNVVEGQIANSITAGRGLYFPPEYINQITLTEMIAGDSRSKANLKLMPKNCALMKALMEHYDILQDASNELQKSSNQSRFKFMSKFNPYYMLMKGEYYNQTPLLAAVLKNTEVKDKDGNVSNVKDAMEPVWDSHSKSWRAKLKEEFRTEDNITSWENANGKDYFLFKNKIREVIKETHGDFDPLSGMMAKSTHLGQAIMMFKTWLPREIHKRFAVEQDILPTGVKGYKGMFRSHTPASAAMYAGLMGTMAFGPIGGAISAVGGLAATKLFPSFFNARSAIGNNTVLGFMQELLLVNKLLVRKALGIPLNPISRLVTKDRRNFISDDREREYNRMKSKSFTAIDYANFKANMQDIAMMCAWFGGLLLTKAMLWDDDDDDDDTRRQYHNLLANQLMSLSSQAIDYASVPGMKNNLTNMAIVKFGTDIGNVFLKVDKLAKGEDLITSGPHAGESALGNQLQNTFLPGVAHSQIGYGKQMERQFVPSPFDSYFYGEEKKAKQQIKREKIRFELKLREAYPDMDDDKFEKMLNKSFGKKKKHESYQQFLNRVKQREVATED